MFSVMLFVDVRAVIIIVVLSSYRRNRAANVFPPIDSGRLRHRWLWYHSSMVCSRSHNVTSLLSSYWSCSSCSSRRVSFV